MVVDALPANCYSTVEDCLQIEASDGRKRDGGHVYPSPSLRFSSRRFVSFRFQSPMSRGLRDFRLFETLLSEGRRHFPLGICTLYSSSSRFVLSFIQETEGGVKCVELILKFSLRDYECFPCMGIFQRNGMYQSRDFSPKKITSYNNRTIIILKL